MFRNRSLIHSEKDSYSNLIINKNFLRSTESFAAKLNKRTSFKNTKFSNASSIFSSDQNNFDFNYLDYKNFIKENLLSYINDLQDYKTQLKGLKHRFTGTSTSPKSKIKSRTNKANLLNKSSNHTINKTYFEITNRNKNYNFFNKDFIKKALYTKVKLKPRADYYYSIFSNPTFNLLLNFQKNENPRKQKSRFLNLDIPISLRKYNDKLKRANPRLKNALNMHSKINQRNENNLNFLSRILFQD